MKPFVIQSTANEDILLFEGDMTFYTGFSLIPEFKCTGKAIFEWLPYPRVSYYFQKHGVTGLVSSNEYKIFHEGLAEATIIYTIHETDRHFVKAFIETYNTGDKSLSFDYIQYQIPNLFGFGFSSGKDLNNRFTPAEPFITFTADDFEITIEHFLPIINVESIIRGGYMLTGAAEIRKSGSKVTLKEADKIMETFVKFLGFFNCHKVTPVIVTGVIDDKISFQSYRSAPDAESFIPTITWTPRKADKEIMNHTWKTFYEFSKNENEIDCLELAVHWYLTSLYKKSGVEASLVLIQNALELLCFWILVEREFILDKNDKEISASSKINVLLTWAGVTNKVSPILSNLDAFSKANSLPSGPETITHIRNKIVHPDLKNRKRYKEFTLPIKHEALQLAIYYCELVLLRLLQYNGRFRDRVHRTRIDDRIGVDNSVPWSNEVNLSNNEKE